MKPHEPQLPDGNDPLDTLLREADEYMPDGGFTARVLHNLPARRSRSWSRLVVLSAALLICIGLVAWQAPLLFAAFCGVVKQPSMLNGQTILALVPLAVALTSLVWILVAVATSED
jgi:uncharacterized membrane protein YcjF (UPF0283 family)